MTTILDKIKAYKLEEVAADKAAVSIADIEGQAYTASPVRGFTAALQSAAQTGYGLIAEIKKASPSKGVIRPDFDAAALAVAYELGGAACLSVLTDQPSFQGSLDYMRAARAVVDLPVLRKDFMFDTYQIAQSRAWGADCILVIMAAVSDSQAVELEDAALALNMDVLIEVHNEDELNRASVLKSPLLGINNRDLKTFETDLDTTRRLSKLAPPEKILVAESGLADPADLADLARYGARSFLIGESLMRESDVATATRILLANPLLAPGGF